MKKTHVLLGIFFLCLSSGLFIFVHSQDGRELIIQADEIYARMQTISEADEALNLYRKALVGMQDKYEAYWKISRLLYFKGYYTENKNDKKAIFSLGVYHAEKAVALKPNQPDGYYWRGVNNGKYGETRGVLKSLSLVKPIKKDMNKVIELDESYEDGGAHRVLGRVFFKVPGIAGGSKEKSLEHLEKSKEIGPEDMLTRYYLAETLLSRKMVERSRAELEYILSQDDDPGWVAGVNECKQMARELLKDKKFRKK